MANTAREWLQLFDQSEERMAELLELLARKRRLEQGSSNAARVKRDIRSQFGVMKDSIGTLERSLSAMESDMAAHGIGQGEWSRRAGLLNQLRARVSEARQQFDGRKPGNAARNQLLQGRGRKNPVQESESTLQMSNQELVSAQMQEHKEQDQALDDILGGVGRLKSMGQDINSELALHAELLDDLDRGVDSTTVNIRDGTRRAENIMQKSSSCAGACTIFVLLVVIIVLLFLPS